MNPTIPTEFYFITPDATLGHCRTHGPYKSVRYHDGKQWLSSQALPAAEFEALHTGMKIITGLDAMKIVTGKLSPVDILKPPSGQ